MFSGTQTSLDPSDWTALRAQGHRMLDDMFDHIAQLREKPVWQPIPASTRAAFQEPLPRQGISLEQAHARFLRDVLPYGVGNAHPGFMGWVQGGGTVEGMLAEMLAAGLNANLGGRDQMPLEVERQIGLWMRALFGFPETSEGLFVTGSSTANLIGVLVARTRALGTASRQHGVGAHTLRAYAAATAHSCITKALEISGLGSDCLRRVPCNALGQLDGQALARLVQQDREAGLQPFLVVATAGTVNTGVIDDLRAVAEVAARERLWFHVDGAFGALGQLSTRLAPRLAGIAQADTLALDFHKWGQVPYDAGYVLVRDGQCQLDTFATPADYLSRQERGLAAGSPWPCDRGPDLSRGFRALKIWFTLVCHGSERLGAVIDHCCDLAQYLAQGVAAQPALELMAPVSLNIVCFRYRCAEPDRVNAEIVADLHESGIAAPSLSSIDGQRVIRAALVNHRSTRADIDALLQATLEFGPRHTAPCVPTP